MQTHAEIFFGLFFAMAFIAKNGEKSDYKVDKNFTRVCMFRGLSKLFFYQTMVACGKKFAISCM